MPQIDTGLGWLAFDNYLIQGTGTIASINEFTVPGYTNLPIPVTGTSAADIGTNGLKIAEGDNYELYTGAAIPNCFVSAYLSGTWLNLDYLAPQQGNNLVYYVTKNKNTGNYGSVNFGSYWQYQGTKSGTTFYYYSSSMNRWDNNLVFYVPSDPRTTLFNSLVYTSMNITKANPGYAVCCLAKWNTGNVVIKSPILISSDSSFVEMGGYGSYNYAKLNYLYEGMRFYMGFLDITDKTPGTQFPIFDKSSAAPLTLDEVFEGIADYYYANIVVGSAPDPYQEDDGSGTGGADGGEDTPANVDFTDPPTTLIGSSGFLTIFCPSLGQLQNLASYMWNTFDLDNWRKIIANPMDAILGLNIIPVPPYVTGTKAVKVAGMSTEIMMDYTTTRYIRRSMGSCDIPKKWGAYLDYSPYTKCSIFLPYIGFQELNVDDIMGKTIGLQYIVDILTGACVAELKCGDTVLYSWTGNCANQVPIASASWNSAITGALSIAATVAGLALTGGASSAMIPGAIASVGANSLNLKPTVNRSGSLGGSSGFIAGQRPYIIRTIPNLVIPADQNKFIGYPSFITASLGSLTGYNEVSAIHLEGIPATANELTEIETILKEGAIF